MKSLRRGREFYSKNYEKVIELYNAGKTVNDIASEMNLSYSCVYHWVKGLRKPEEGNVASFEKFIKDSGPISAMEIKEKFPKHNELFLTAQRRKIEISRCILPRKYGEYNTWYFMQGQEELLKERISELMKKYKEAKEKIVEILDNFVKS